MKSAPDRKAIESALDQRPKHSTAPALLVTLDHGQPWTDSLLVAQKFGRAHKAVLRSIEKKQCSDDFRQRNFAPAEYIDEQGKPRRMYRLTGGREVPGVDRRAVRALHGQSGFIKPELVGMLALIAGPAAVAIAALVRFLGLA